MRVLITGGYGYLGGRLATALAAHSGTEVLLGSRSERSPPTWLPSARPVRTTWDQPDTLDAALLGVDAIVHATGPNAASVLSDPGEATDRAVQAAANLSAAAASHGVGRLVYVSTAHVYGTLAGAIHEDTPTEPIHPYGSMHLAVERSLASTARDETSCLIARLANGFGAPADPTPDCWSLLLNDLCRQAVSSGVMAMRSRSLTRRDLVPMRAAVRAISHLVALRPRARMTETYNVGSGWAPTNLEAAERLARILRDDSEVVLDAGELMDSPAPPPLAYSTRKLAETGFAPEVDIDAELRDLIDFCRTHFS